MAKEGTNVNIPINGITRNTSSTSAADGELEEIVNLRKKYGRYEPVGTHKLVTIENIEYTQLYVHTCKYRHLLGVKDGSVYWFANLVDDEDSTEPTVELLETPISLCTIIGKIKITQVGNLITINDTEVTYYFLFDPLSDEYKIPNNDFNGDKNILNSPPMGKICLRNTLARDKGYPIVGHSFEQTADFSDAIKVYNGWEIGAATSPILYKMEDAGRTEGLLTHHYYIVCTAFELYDGSFILSSNYTLLKPVNEVNKLIPKYTSELGASSIDWNPQDSWVDDNDNILKESRLMYGFPILDLEAEDQDAENDRYNDELSFIKTTCYDFNAVDNQSISEYLLYLESVDGFKVDPLHEFNVSGTTASRYHNVECKDIDIYPSYECSIRTDKDTVYLNMLYSKLQIKFDSDIDIAYKDIIKGVCVFMSEPIDHYDYTNNYAYIYGYGSYNTVTHDDEIFIGDALPKGRLRVTIPERPVKDIVDDLYNFNQLYKVAEYSFDNIKKSDDWIDVDLKDTLSIIYNQQTLSDTSFRGSTVSEINFPYNGRLHVANVAETYFLGYTYDDFKAPEAGEGFKEIESIRYTDAYLGVNLDNTNTTLVRESLKGSSQVFANFYSLSPILCYPSTLASSIKIVVNSFGENGAISYLLNGDMKACNFQNTSMYINPTLDYNLPVISDEPVDIPILKNETTYTVNKIKVSSTDNPLYFPAANTYLVGNSPIIGMAANSAPMPDGQMGASPLFVFSEDGIYGLFVDSSGELAYTNSMPISREACNNADSITAVEDNILFTTNRGLMALTGTTVQDMSDIVEGIPYKFFDSSNVEYTPEICKCINHNRLVELLDVCDDVNFLDYITNAIIGYNYKDKELWITNPDKNYSYVVSDGLWTKRNIVFTEFINDYPRLYSLTADGILKNVEEEEHLTYTESMFLTRPIKYSTLDFKQHIRSILRCYLEIGITGTTPYDYIINESDYSSYSDRIDVPLNQTCKFIYLDGSVAYFYNVSAGLENYSLEWIKSYISNPQDFFTVIEATPELDAFAGFYILGSYDCKKWKLIGGRELKGIHTDIGLLAHRVDCKYFRFLFVGKLLENSTIDFIDTEINNKLTANKLR